MNILLVETALKDGTVSGKDVKAPSLVKCLKLKALSVNTARCIALVICKTVLQCGRQSSQLRWDNSASIKRSAIEPICMAISRSEICSIFLSAAYLLGEPLRAKAAALTSGSEQKTRVSMVCFTSRRCASPESRWSANSRR